MSTVIVTTIVCQAAIVGVTVWSALTMRRELRRELRRLRTLASLPNLAPITRIVPTAAERRAMEP